MSSSELEREPPHLRFGALLALLRKSVPRRRGALPGERVRRDLERLALSAPHLLADIGFHCDPVASTPDRTVWRRGALSVAILATGPTVHVSLR